MKKFLTLVLLISSFTFNSRAADVLGGDISWECLGNGSYTFMLTLYTECNGPDLDTVALDIAECSSSKVLPLNKIMEEDVTPICKHQCTRCGDPSCSFPYGIKKVVFIGNTVLSSSCNETYISWNHCCRSPIITTGSQNQSFYLDARMYRDAAPCNSSPKFTASPVTIQCAGQCSIYNQGVVNTDGDSLVYSETFSLNSPQIPFQYDSPYTYDKPLQFAGFPVKTPDKQCRGFFLDSLYGDLFFQPMKSQATVYAIKVEEYRNGQKISELTRSLSFIITNCPPNNYPVISGINGGNNFSAITHPGQPLSFSIITDDDDNMDTLTIDWNGGIPGANFTVGSGRTPTATFTWTASANDVSFVPYFFTVSATDDACPKSGTTIRSFSITVAGPNGIDENMVEKFTLYPNPARNQVELLFETGMSGSFNVVITDVAGNILRQQEMLPNEAVQIKRAGLANGLYFVSIYKEGQRLVTKKLLWN